MTGSVGPEGMPAEASMAAEDVRLSQLGYKPELSRSLSLGDVVIHGLIYMVPIAPISVFGVVYNLSVGAAAAVYVITAIVMTFSALSYREMALQFPVAGSVYSYVRLGTSTFLGFISGWAILLDYLLLPALLCVFASARHGLPGHLRAGLGLGHRLRRGNGPHQHHGRLGHGAQ